MALLEKHIPSIRATGRAWGPDAGSPKGRETSPKNATFRPRKRNRWILPSVMVDAVYHRKPPDGRIRIGASQSAGADPGTVINPTADPTKTLQSFTQDDLAQFTLEQRYSDNPSNDFHLFYVGRDDVHEILKYILSRARVLLYLNMFGCDDGELNTILMEKAKDPNVTMLVTLDESQAGGKRERQLIELDQSTEDGLAAFNTHFAIGQSATHQISQTKGFVADGKVGAEGSTNWSASGEGTFVVTDIPVAPATAEQHAIGLHRHRHDRSLSNGAGPGAAQKGGPVVGSAGAQREPPRPRRRATKVTPEEPSSVSQAATHAWPGSGDGSIPEPSPRADCSTWTQVGLEFRSWISNASRVA